MLRGHDFAGPPSHGGQNNNLLVYMFDGYAQICCKRYHNIFETFFMKLKCKIYVQKGVIHNFQKSHLDHVTIRFSKEKYQSSHMTS